MCREASTAYQYACQARVFLLLKGPDEGVECADVLQLVLVQKPGPFHHLDQQVVLGLSVVGERERKRRPGGSNLLLAHEEQAIVATVREQLLLRYVARNIGSQPGHRTRGWFP
jgi:hypothetical protein